MARSTTVKNKSTSRSRKKDYKKLFHLLDINLKAANEVRQPFTTRIRQIDMQLSGFIKMSKEDKKRHADNLAGKPPKPTKHNLSMTASQIDDFVTFLLNVFAPEGNLFEAISHSSKQNLANGLANFLNEQGEYAQYYRHLSKACRNMAAYNMGGWFVNWERDNGILFEPQNDGSVAKKEGVVWEGNRMLSIDMYNFLWDPTVHPVDLAVKGEFFAFVEAATEHQLRKMAHMKQIEDVEDIINKVPQDVGGNIESYWECKPTLRHENETSTASHDWLMDLTGEAGATTGKPAYELIHYFGWMRGKDYNLDASEDLNLYHITIANGNRIANIHKLENSHGMLPVAIACPIEDDNGIEQRTYAEQLLPLQNFASFLLNTHQDATRKSLYGVTVYNPTVFPGFSDMHGDDLTSGLIPIQNAGYDVDVRKHIYQFNDAPETGQNLAQVGQVDEFMQRILPTDLLRQVANLDRATMYQAAATVQSANRRSYKIARVIASQAITVLKMLMIYNVFGNLKSFEYFDENGQRIPANIATVLKENVELDVGSGLKGLDRLMMVQVLETILSLILQSQAALEEIDILSLLNYFTSLAGDKTNLKQFRKTPEQQQLDAPQTGGDGQ